ncbi:two component transcriptional regulator, LuxR family [Leptothrix cholodnii SP-6]|uniref:Two component transcriptional regulator, LuxR family n=1 Tax=Leptothrix cholodnii (strain ATCC 51168 / LMG 8142 / SP-6) TaxID=395495 RepID=B1Y7F6_LEPCP|nr:response regulator transcription factor [Leptothrix cholodnii]ACB36104.1 two component transcriptional regulator, LuxR family [Leptothrix cholodnii SP-6]
MSVTDSSVPTPPPATPWRIALADDHAIVRVGYRRLLELEPDLSVVAEYADADSAAADLCQARRTAVDLLILDLSMPGRSGLDLLRQLQRDRPALKVLMVSMHDSAALVGQCLGAGACGFVAKSSDPQALIGAVRQALRGEVVDTHGPSAPPRAGRRPLPHEQLTGRELEVLQLLLAGLGVEVAAARIGLSEKTVSNYQTQIRQKLGVANSIELVHYARQHGLMP